MRSKRVCFVQSHYTNVRKDDPDPTNYCIQKIKDANIFDEIVLAAADLPENLILHEFAKEWGVSCYLGSVDNVARRMLQVAQNTNSQSLTRMLVDWFYTDVSLVEGMLDHQETKHLDYVYLPYDFDIKFGADVHSTKGLEALCGLLSSDPGLEKQHAFRPWYLLELNPHNCWQTGEHPRVPNYPISYLREIQKKMHEVTPLAWDYGLHFYYHEYVYALNHIQSQDFVVDVACGMGSGSNVLSEKAAKVTGVDIRPHFIEAAKKAYQSPNLEYQVGDALNLDFGDNSIDIVVSIHTMEHLEDDKQFLREVLRILKPGGKLLVEVPLRMCQPFVGSDVPVMIDHVREYEKDALANLMLEHFTVIAKYGVNRGYYCEMDKARNAAAFVCAKT